MNGRAEQGFQLLLFTDKVKAELQCDPYKMCVFFHFKTHTVLLRLMITVAKKVKSKAKIRNRYNYVLYLITMFQSNRTKSTLVYGFLSLYLPVPCKAGHLISTAYYPFLLKL